MKKIIFSLCFVLLIVAPLAAAFDVSAGQGTKEYQPGDIVKIDITACSAKSFVTISNPWSQAVFTDLGSGVWSTSYNTLSDPSLGKYTVIATCGSQQNSTDFTLVTPSNTPPNQGGSGGGSGRSGGGSGRGGSSGGSSLGPCGAWSFCNATLQHSRECFNKQQTKVIKVEVQTCSACEENWRCSDWTACSAGQQQRECTDDHACRTSAQKPIESRTCTVGSQLGQQNFQEPYQPPQNPIYAEPEASFWQKYKTWIISGVSTLFVLLIVVVLVIYFMHHHKGYNTDELEEWVRKERELGVSEEEMRKILADNTEWTDKEITQALAK